MNDTYNANHVPTLGMVEDLVLMAVNSVKSWTTDNIDRTELVANIKAQLDIANREVIGDTAAEKCQHLLNCINDITTALRNAGAVIPDSTPLSDFATLITQISATGYEVCILGKSGTHYSAAEWSEYIAQHDTTPEEAVVAVITPFQSFVIGTAPQSGYPTRQWGNATDSVLGLYSQQQGSFLNVLQNSLIFNSLENTYRMLLWYDPEVLPHINYDPSAPDNDYESYACVRFATKAEMEASGLQLAYDRQVYIVTDDETDSTTDQAYYWDGTAYTRRFQVPRVANSITGSPAAKYAWEYKAWDGDTRQYALPTTNHLLMMYVYYTQINACLSALDRSVLPTGSSWTCQQLSANNAYGVIIPSCAVSNYIKTNFNVTVVPVAAL